MKVLILTGGTGSIALQTGIYQLYEKHPGLQVKILTNAYDNGKSTGTVRKVLNGQILGPSDVRKNQTTRLKLENPQSPLNEFLDIRFDLPAKEVEKFCLDKIDELTPKLQMKADAFILQNAIKSYFESPNSLRVDYSDFSIANIIYAGLASANGNSLRAAAKIMSGILGIKDNVILNDDTSLFLGATSKRGISLTDEGDIVEWGKKDDPLVDVFFFDVHGNLSTPKLCNEAYSAIQEANLIILSSGTQWSSLIPTYDSEGFKEAIVESKAKIVMVMNTYPDKDSPGQSAGDIVDAIVPKYFDEKRISVVCNSKGHSQMMASTIPKELVHRIVEADMTSDKGPKFHDPIALTNAVFSAYFDIPQEFQTIICDYDDTLVARGNAFHGVSKDNMNTLCRVLPSSSIQNRVICTGNSIKAINKDYVDPFYNPITMSSLGSALANVVVYADGGINRYALDADNCFELVETIDPEFIFSVDDKSHIIDVFQENKIPLSKVENRNNVCMSIKPVDTEFRYAVCRRLQEALPEFSVSESGRTTIDITKSGLNKSFAVIQQLEGVSPNDFVLYIGDEVESGNDKVVSDLTEHYPNLFVYNVTSVIETNILLKTLLR